MTAGLAARISDDRPAEPAAQSAGELLRESFEGESLDASSWGTCYWWGCTIPSNKELQWYEPSQVTVSGGVLYLTAEAVPVENPDGERFAYRSGMISSGPSERGGKPKFAFTYGTVEARLRVPAGTGLWSALWMLPAFRDSRPEIDIVEVLGSNTRKSYQSFHGRDRKKKPLQHTEKGADLADGWHDYRLEWLPGRLRWYVDGKHVFTVKGDEVPDEPMYVMANLAVGGKWPRSPNETTRFPASLAIDYITVRPAAR
ncbi:glycoside hydrolase family 16 protein [Micromonospora sp. NPDC049679]|uniref:glycoside hydrolase family 16 protein n=1 Tax=Micromonospora sp. NPDC049679 TaxID=3155920 RepID=UPI0033FC5510